MRHAPLAAAASLIAVGALATACDDGGSSSTTPDAGSFFDDFGNEGGADAGDDGGGTDTDRDTGGDTGQDSGPDPMDAGPDVVEPIVATGFTGLFAGPAETCGIKSGLLYCWGNLRSVTPTRTVALESWTQIARGDQHTCALDIDSGLWCWGQGRDGQLGTGDREDAAEPVNIGTAPWRKVAVGQEHSCGIQDDGTLWCWGRSRDGQLGFQPQEEIHTPTQVGETTGWTDLAANTNFTCGIRDGQILCWGQRWDREELEGPTAMDESIGWTSVALGPAHLCGIQAGALRCMGHNRAGELGVDPAGILTTLTPVTADDTLTWDEVGAGTNLTCARSGTEIHCAGDNQWGALGRGDQTSDWRLERVPGEYDQLAVGYFHACGRTTRGTAACWGWNHAGQLGVGALPITQALELVARGDFTDVSAQPAHSCALDGDRAFCWGTNQTGNLGDGTRRSAQSPSAVAGDHSWTQIAAGASHGCGVQTDGTLWCWGTRGGAEASDVPVQVGDGSDWTHVDTVTHVCGLRGEGELWCFGNNAQGQLGADFAQIEPSPVRIGDQSDWTAVSAGPFRTCGLRAGGQLWCVGMDMGEEMTRVGRAANWSDISLRFGLACGLRAGELFCWTPPEQPVQRGTHDDWIHLETPVALRADGSLHVQLLGPQAQPRFGTGWSQATGSQGHVCALRDGDLYCGGLGQRGQLGLGRTFRTEPNPVIE